jgi:DNA replication initiation complex subunit (GINS family)
MFNLDTLCTALTNESSEVENLPEQETNDDNARQSDLRPLNDQWFNESEQYLDKMMLNLKTVSNDHERDLLTDELHNAIFAIEGLYNRRLPKILDLASLNADGADIDIVSMETFELELYQEIFRILSDHRGKFKDRFFKSCEV